MFIAFPADEKIKARLDAVCKSLGITYEEWFDTALKASEFDVLVKFLDHPEDQTSWKWDENLRRFVRRSGTNKHNLCYKESENYAIQKTNKK